MTSELPARPGALIQDSATESPTSTTPTSQPPSFPPRSCHGCNSKKIRCDRAAPSCAACARAGRLCTFPPAGPRVRRTKRALMADMSSRIAGLERSLARAAVDEARSVQRLPSSSPSLKAASTAMPSADLGERSSEDVLVERGSSSQYFNEVLFSKVIDKEREFESALSTSHTATPRPPVASPFNASGILSSPCLTQLPYVFHPAQSLAVRLWNIYVENVESCLGLKLLHIPTHQVRAFSVINDPKSASFENLALCFAVYFAATISVDDAEQQSVLMGHDKLELLHSFKLGLEQAFAHGDFLDRPTITGLHALAIYIFILRVNNRGKGIWILNGLAIRMAQSLGLHRDGSRLGVSPFQAEIRRRLWWHLLSRDNRSGEDYGLENTSGLSLASGVSLPLNIDDSDLSPEMKELPRAKTGWTSMTFSLINIDVTKAMQRLAAIAGESSHTSPPSETVRAKIIADTKLQTEERLQGCNPLIPKQRQILLCSQFVLRKLDFVTQLQWELLKRPGPPRADLATEERLLEALEILAPRLHHDDGLLKQFAWGWKAYPQYHVPLYVLWHLRVKPEGPSVDRAWSAVDTLFARDGWEDHSSIGFSSKPAVLAALKAKALAARRGVADAHVRGGEAAGEGVMPASAAEELSDFESAGISAFLLGDMGGNVMSFEREGERWPSWDAEAQGLEPLGGEFLWR